MMDKTFKLEIVTPRKTVFDAPVQSVSAPGALGGFQVLVNHAPLLSSLRVGELKLLDQDGKEIRFATSGGFLEVRKNVVTLLAETAERADEIDVERQVVPVLLDRPARDDADLAEVDGIVDLRPRELFVAILGGGAGGAEGAGRLFPFHLRWR